MSDDLISIGLPVYNGGEPLRRAIECLLAQTHTNFELIISDNASTDDLTQKITEEYAARDSRIKLTRQPVNLGGLPNFMWVLKQAKGKYFLWAAHDDFWSSNYLTALSSSLDAAPDAALAAPRILVLAGERKGEIKQIDVPAPPSADRWTTLSVFAEDKFAGVWIYGLYRRDWLLNHAEEWLQYPWNMGDVIWMFGTVLRARVVGNNDALFHYTCEYRKYHHLSRLRKTELQGVMLLSVLKLAWAMPKNERYQSLKAACHFIYCRILRRGNIIRTGCRIAKLPLVFAWIGLEKTAKRMFHRAATPQPAPVTLTMAAQKNESTNLEQRRAA